jgi:hypothetical protein
LFALVLNPLKNAEQYEWLPPGSLDDEQALVLLELWAIKVETGAGPPMPPVRVDPDAVAENEAVANKLLCVTAVDKG